ncbi:MULTISPECIES: hypothetical protein [unclassified Pseudocitrobacter]|uniref:hypothetical protein n=1 Tax=unclassified Pseudocitrobacter TaxID=2638778 RepID=UPI0023E38C48|nr:MULTISPECIES: hypothetical protein [unclassified Pseudocitrobacter]MDF3830852.1 hypothetical protein [Pseudocitrobacter sp. 2023EL-00150]MEC5376442.1 hypothetical protein [Pseudocitrobacter sp. MW920760]
MMLNANFINARPRINSYDDKPAILYRVVVAQAKIYAKPAIAQAEAHFDNVFLIFFTPGCFLISGHKIDAFSTYSVIRPHNGRGYVHQVDTRACCAGGTGFLLERDELRHREPIERLFALNFTFRRDKEGAAEWANQVFTFVDA